MPNEVETKRLMRENGVPIAGATITVGAEAGDTINVAIQLTNPQGGDIDHIGVVDAYLSSDSGGDGLASAPSGGVAIGTDGTILKEYTTDVFFTLQSESDGDIDIDITTSSSGDDPSAIYLVVVLPGGKIVVSDAIDFTSS